MKKYNSRHNLLFVLIEILFVLFNIAYFLFLKNKYIGSAEYNFSDILFNILLYILISVLLITGSYLNRLFSFLINGIITLYLISEHIYERAFHQFYRFKLALSLRNEVAGVKSSVAEFIKFEDVMPFIVLIICCISFFLITVLYERKHVKKKIKLIYWIITVLIGLCLTVPVLANIKKLNEGINELSEGNSAFQFTDDFYIYDTISNTIAYKDKFGILSFAQRDIQSFNESKDITDSDLDSITAFLNERPSTLSENEFTGIFEGKNILMVQAESLNNIGINEILTPTLYKIQQNSIRIRNFNTPALPGSTSDTEFMTNTSLIPNSSEEANCYHFAKNTYPSTLARIFNDAGYVTYIYHNNYGSYYNRTEMFKTLGYDEFFDSTKLGVEDGSKDSDAVKTIGWMHYGWHDKFLEYWITFSGHQSYDYESVGVAEEDIETILSIYPDLEPQYVSYLAKAMDLDRALADYLWVTNYNEELDNTVIVLFGDHIAKELDFTEKGGIYREMGLEYSDEYTYTDLYIYNVNQKPVVYDKVATALDLLPTIANMWNLKLNNQTILGRDIFDPEYKGFYFSEWEKWRTDNYYYDHVKDEYTFVNDYDLEDAKEEMQYYIKLKAISRLLLKSDYFKNYK